MLVLANSKTVKTALERPFCTMNITVANNSFIKDTAFKVSFVIFSVYQTGKL